LILNRPGKAKLRVAAPKGKTTTEKYELNRKTVTNRRKGKGGKIQTARGIGAYVRGEKKGHQKGEHHRGGRFALGAAKPLWGRTKSLRNGGGSKMHFAPV